MEGMERAVEYFRESMKEDVDTLGYRKYFYFDLSIEALQKQIPKMADFKHDRGDEVALITCPICNRSIIANLERYEEFNKEWYCQDCGQKLTLKEVFDNWDDEPNCCDCEFTYDGGDCDNCTMD